MLNVDDFYIKLIQKEKKDFKNQLCKYKLLSHKKNFPELTFWGRIENINKPLIVYFQGYGGKFYPETSLLDINSDQLKMCNVIWPEDRSGYRRQGSGYIGGPLINSPYIRLFQILFNLLSQKTKYSELLFAGASMGGYGALLHSLFNKVSNVYISVPQTSLNPNSWYYNIDDNFEFKETNINSWGRKYLNSLGINNEKDFINLENKFPFINIPNCLKKIKNNKIKKIEFEFNQSTYYINLKIPDTYYHLTACRFDHPKDDNSNYLKEFICPLIEGFTEANIHFSSSILPIIGHEHFHKPSDILIHFIRYKEYNSLRAGKLKNTKSSRYVIKELKEKKDFTNLISLEF